ncbi:hypothetical protein QBC47DRAFT_380744 [Echria macrotheca]|uniref:Uncharacterized protein n=1 Tax=Echria macrotheca TaxID=438768 RepID=A0AAJ0BE39_9PEZI|nr:hypothetical protein QBC47DRAFT_380744 [Echria macrotheca]
MRTVSIPRFSSSRRKRFLQNVNIDRARKKMADVTFTSDNTTIALNSSLANTTALDGGSNVSLGEVFGMFLTLSFCLVSQPSGSLIYRPWPFLFWRLSPIGCLAETAFVFLCFTGLLIGVFATVMDDNRFEDIPVRWRRWAAMAADFHRKFRHESHSLACALLLVRADVGKEKPQALAMLEKLGDTGLFDADCANRNTTEGGRGLLGTAQERPEVDVEREAGSTQQSTTPEETAAHESSATAVTATLPANAEATAQTYPQESQTIDLTTITRSAQQAVALRQAFGANVFAHRELSVQAVIFLSITSVAAKLCTSTLPSPLASALFFMLFSWLSVQIVLFIFHSRPVQETGIKTITETIRTVVGLVYEHSNKADPDHADLPGVMWGLVGVVTGIPLMPLVLYGNIPKRWDAPDPIALDYVALWILRVLGTGTVLIVVWMPRKLAEEEAVKKDDEPEWGTWQCIFFTIVVILAYVDVLVSGDLDANDSRVDTYLSNTFLWAINIFAPCMLLPILCGLGTPVFPTSKVGTAVAQGLVLGGTAFVFVLWMAKYDPAGTSQPDWIKWLG